MVKMKFIVKMHFLALISVVMLNSGCGSSSSSSSTPDTTPPSVPTYLTAVAVTDTKVALRWLPSTDNVGVTSYVINRDGSRLATTTTNATVYSDTTCTASTAYTYEVAALDSAGNESAFSTSATTTTYPAGTGDISTPAAPTSLTAARSSSSAIALLWTASISHDVSGYNIYRSTSSTGPFTTNIGVTTTTTFVDTGLTTGTTYYYEVTAFSGVPIESLFSNEASATP